MDKFQNVKRWWHHMRSFNESEISLFPVTQTPEVMLKFTQNHTKDLDAQVGFYYISAQLHRFLFVKLISAAL